MMGVALSSLSIAVANTDLLLLIWIQTSRFQCTLVDVIGIIPVCQAGKLETPPINPTRKGYEYVIP